MTRYKGRALVLPLYIGQSVGRLVSAYIFGAICPNRGVGAAMITPAANTGMMNLHLAEISTQVAPGSMAALGRVVIKGIHKSDKA